MPRVARSKVIVEELAYGTLDWGILKGGFKSTPEAEQWVKDNIKAGQTLRVAKISGVFNAKTTVIKR